MRSDYKDMGQLDQYDEAGLDNREFAGGLSYDARRAADEEMSARDRREGRRRGRAEAAMYSDGGA